MFTCNICCEERTQGYSCVCKNEVCFDCDFNLNKCPYCRREFPSLLERISARGITTETVLAVGKLVSASLESRDRDIERAQTHVDLFLKGDLDEDALNDEEDSVWYMFLNEMEEEVYGFFMAGMSGVASEILDFLQYAGSIRVQDMIEDITNFVENEVRNERKTPAKCGQKRFSISRRHLKIQNLLRKRR